MPYLIGDSGPVQGRVFPLAGNPTTLGRHTNNHIVLAYSAAISRQQAAIRFENGRFLLHDGNPDAKPRAKASRDGTALNGAKIPFPGWTPIQQGDILGICESTFSFHEADPPPDQDSVSSSFDGYSDPDSGSVFRQTAQKLRSLLELSNRLSNTLDLDRLLPQVVEGLLQIFRQAERGFLVRVHEGTGELELHSHRGQDPHLDVEPAYSESIVRQCLAMKKGLFSNNLRNDYPSSSSVASLGIRAVMCAPLWSRGGEAFGVLLLDARKPKKPFTPDDLDFLVGVANQASIAIANARYHREALEREGLVRDMALAKQVVKSFLPAGLPAVPGYDFYAFNESALGVGGDLYDFVELTGNRLAVLVGDVAGKGVSAALVMARFSAEARACLRTEPDLATAVGRLNTLMQPLGLADRFVSLVAMVLDPATHTLTTVNAGHPPPLVLRAATGICEEVLPRRSAGLLLGVQDGFPYQAHDSTLQPGDSVVLFSDGVNEAEDSLHHRFGIPRVHAVLNRGLASPGELGPRLLAAVREHASEQPQNDDITLVCLGRRA